MRALRWAPSQSGKDEAFALTKLVRTHLAVLLKSVLRK